jgi:hypothetical protein
MDCKIVMIEGEEKVLLVGCTEHCRCFKIQQKLGGNAYNMPMYIRTEEKVILIFKKEACYSIQSSLSLKAIKISLSGNPNGKIKENGALIS